MLNSVSPSRYDIILLQEPYIDDQGFSRGSMHWTMVYPPAHRTPGVPFRETRSLILVSTRLSSNAWYSLEVPSRDITGIRITLRPHHSLLIYNIYN
ncbi:hypothetical protein BC629DRAFT_1289431, partial [Irpex lacteus]